MNAVIDIHNEHAMIFASSVVIDTTKLQLVAAVAVSNSQDLLKAIKATLMTNGKRYVTVRSPEGSDFLLEGARRGYITTSGNLQAAHAEGHLVAWLHPLCGNPQENAAEHFYLVIAPNQDLYATFAERLNLAIPWPVSPAWADKLLGAGQAEGLVERLAFWGKDFAHAFRIRKAEGEWAGIISNLLRNKSISL